jgi:hypothetical protein
MSHDLSILPVSPLVASIREKQLKQLNELGRLLEDPNDIPGETSICSRCDKALWLVLDRSLVCYCGRAGKTTWAPGSSGSSVQVTMCDEVIAQAIKKQAETQTAEQTPAADAESVVQADPSRSRTI